MQKPLIKNYVYILLCNFSLKGIRDLVFSAASCIYFPHRKRNVKMLKRRLKNKMTLQNKIIFVDALIHFRRSVPHTTHPPIKLDQTGTVETLLASCLDLLDRCCVLILFLACFFVLRRNVYNKINVFIS